MGVGFARPSSAHVMPQIDACDAKTLQSGDVLIFTHGAPAPNAKSAAGSARAHAHAHAHAPAPALASARVAMVYEQPSFDAGNRESPRVQMMVMEASAEAGCIRLEPLASRVREHLEKSGERRCYCRRLNIRRSPRQLRVLGKEVARKLGLAYDRSKYTQLAIHELAHGGGAVSTMASACCWPHACSRSRTHEEARRKEDLAARIDHLAAQRFASEMVADMWMHLGVLVPPSRAGAPASHYSPWHFWPGTGSRGADELKQHLTLPTIELSPLEDLLLTPVASGNGVVECEDRMAPDSQIVR